MSTELRSLNFKIQNEKVRKRSFIHSDRTSHLLVGVRHVCRRREEPIPASHCGPLLQPLHGDLRLAQAEVGAAPDTETQHPERERKVGEVILVNIILKDTLYNT